MLCAAMAALWVRSYWRDSSLDFCSRSHRLSLRIVRGHVAFEVFTPEEPFEMDERGFFNTSFADSGGGSDLEWMISSNLSGHKSNLGGIGFSLSRETVGFDVQQAAVVPAWFVIAICAILPTWRMVRAFSPSNELVCPHCSYNLTGNTSGVCPECGRQIK